MKKYFKNNSVLTVIIITVVFGLGAGVVGSLLVRTYFLESAYNIPFFGEIDFSSNYNGSSLIIRGAKKVIVEQNSKVTETVNAVNHSVVGIFKKISEAKTGADNAFELSEYYNIEDEASLGLVVTSDGWIITNNFNIGLTKETLAANYVVITKNGQIFEIDKLVDDKASAFMFIHVKNARDLPVIELASDNEIIGGQVVAVLNWDEMVIVSSIIGLKDKLPAGEVKSSDIFFDELVIRDALSKDFADAVLFNLSGKIIGMAGNDLKIEFMSRFKPLIESLLKNGEVMRASLGVNYIDLATLVSPDKGNQDLKGALIYKDLNGLAFTKTSSAKEAGLEVGDIITYVNNIEINKNNNLTYVIQSFIAGDKVNIRYVRDGEESEVEVEL